MTSPTTYSTPHPGAARAASAAPPRPVASPLDRPILGHAVLVAVAGDALFREGPGLGVSLWVAVFAAAAWSLVWRAGRVVPREAGAWLATAVLFAAALAWRDSGALVAFDILAAAGALAMAGVALGAPDAALFADRLRDTVRAVFALAISVFAGLPTIVLGELRAPAAEGRSRPGVRPVLRAGAIAAGLLLVFGSLLRDADPIFASVVALPDFAVDEVVSHVFLLGFFAWLASGWARGALVDDAGPRPAAAPAAPTAGLSALDVTAALGTVALLFAAFVAAQLGWLFGGEAFLRERTGLTAAAYARGGFFQMVWVAVLVVPLLVATRAALRPGAAVARRHTALALPVLGLLGAMLLSSVLRLRLYVHYYGLTTDRLYPLVFMGWLALVLAWLVPTVLRGRGRTFVAGSVVSLLATLAALNLAAPDAVVARVNLARAARGAPLDLPYLASLSGEAAPMAVRATLAAPAAAPGVPEAGADRERCRAALRLLRRWGPASHAAERREHDAAWRSWNAGEARAIEAVGAHAAELHRAVSACPARPS